jgi:hypothetical protein
MATVTTYAIAAIGIYGGDHYWQQDWYEDGEWVDSVHTFYSLREVAREMRRDVQHGEQPAMRYYPVEEWAAHRLEDVVLSTNGWTEESVWSGDE